MKSTEFLIENDAALKELEQPTNDFIKLVQRMMKTKGWRYKAKKHSASGQWSWYDDKGEREVSLAGWHGLQPARWGAGRVIHDMYYTEKYITTKKIKAFDIDTGTPKEDYENNLNTILGFMQKL